MAPSFTWNGARRETRVNRLDMKSSEWAAWNCNRLVCFLTLLTLFAQNVFEWCIQITVKTKIEPLCATAQLRPHCTIRRKNTSLPVNCTPHATCIAHIADTNFMSNASVIIFEFRLMTV
jgi:hypothetical protein